MLKVTYLLTSILSLCRYLIVATANAIPRYHTLDHLRVMLYRAVGLTIGKGTRIAGPLNLEFSFRLPTMTLIEIGADTFIAYNCRIATTKARVTIGARCNVGPNVSIETAGHWFNKAAGKRNTYHKPVTVADNVWLGAGCIILPGISVGENSVVAAGAVVAKDVPSSVLVGGVPARVIKTLDEFRPEPLGDGATDHSPPGPDLRYAPGHAQP